MKASTRIALRFGSKSGLLHGCLALAVLAAAPGAHPQAPPSLSVQVSNGYARLSLSGHAGTGCTIQSAASLLENWQFVTNLTLLTNESLVVVAAGPMSPQRLYRVYAQQAPTNVVPANLVWVSPGTFTMGSPVSDVGSCSCEYPQTRVTISHGFWMGKYKVTQGEYLSLMGNNPSWFNGPRYSAAQDQLVDYGTDLSRPVEEVSLDDAVAYCTALAQAEQQAGRLPSGCAYRLPTEAEREYACRAGTTTVFYYGPSLRSGMANFNGYYEFDPSAGTIYNPDGTYLEQTTPVGSYAPNAWGLYDMHGNLWEWTTDWFAKYAGGSVIDPQGPATGSSRVLRGGSWNRTARDCRSADRLEFAQDSREDFIGFRVVLAPAQP